MEKNTKYPVWNTIKILLKNLIKKNKALIPLFILYTLTATAYPFFGVLLPKFLIEELSLGNLAELNNIIYIVLTYLLFAGTFGFTMVYIKDYCYPRITELRIDYLKDLFVKLINLDFIYTEDSKFLAEHERALEANSNNANGVEGVYHKLFETPAVILTTLIFIVFIGYLNIWILLALILNLLAGLFINTRVNSIEYSMKEDFATIDRKRRYYNKTTYDFSFGKDVRIYGFVNRILDNYSKEIINYKNVAKILRNKEFVLGFIGLFTLLVADIATYGILVYKTFNGMSIADFSMYILAIGSLSVLLKTLSTDISFVLKEGQYAHDFFDFLKLNLSSKGGKLKKIENDTLEIEFKNVSFKYPRTEDYIIKNLNFKINKGERLAIVGINGAGKSTIVKLMTGLLEPDEGEILINNININDFDKQELYKMFSVVFQDVQILAFTIKENVACTSENINEERVMNVLDRVGLGEKIRAFPKGINQMMLKIIDENGTQFSGGENQKLSIARALYKDANMVIMDEPTAALDALAEAEIYENFDGLVQGKTAIYISHRLASTKFCDKIALFDKDGLKEYGNHHELMDLKGSYYEMFTVQGKYYNEGGEENAQHEEA